MKKIVYLCIAIMLCMITVGCGRNPNAKALEKFSNQDMAKVYVKYNTFNKDYEKLSDNMQTPEKCCEYINKKLITQLDVILKDVDGIKTNQKEITDLKEKYRKIISGYRDGLADYVVAVNKKDTKGVQKAIDKFNAVSKDLDDYNNTLHKLAKKYKLKVIDTK